MSLANDVRLIGYCADKPKMKKTKNGKSMAVLVVYTRDHIGNGEHISQPHRCISFSKVAEYIVNKAEKGKHVYVRGTLRTKRVGEGKNSHYYTNIFIEEFKFTPVQGMLAIKGTIREILEKENITSCEQLDFFQDREINYD